MFRSKFKIGEHVKGNDKKASFRERTGVVVERLPKSSEYGINFDDRPGVVEHALSSWLDATPLADKQAKSGE